MPRSEGLFLALAESTPPGVTPGAPVAREAAGLWIPEGSSADCEGREQQLGRSTGRGREQAPTGCETFARHHRPQRPAAVRSP